MKGFLERMQWKMAAWMQGRYGTDSLSNLLVVVALVAMVLSVVPGLDLLSWVALACLAVAMFRSFSKNVGKRAQENESFLRITERPRKWLAHKRIAWKNRKTTLYFTCKNCGQQLSVPRGKGTLRVVCPKCKTETTKKS